MVRAEAGRGTGRRRRADRFVAATLNPVERALRRMVEALGGLGAPGALVGGLAVSARAEPRTTRDVDIAMWVSGDDEAEAVAFRMQSQGYVVQALLEHEPTGKIATIRFRRSSERGVYIDLLFASSGIEREVVRSADLIEVLPSVAIRVASRAHLIALKVLSRDDRRRPQDWDDLRALLADSSESELREAHEALGLITARGFSRGRELANDLERAIAEFKKHA